ncbi:MAG TPA: aldehyde dehydrogenase family protein [Patescibacteria group bacterium]|nr:aldehyde dehydrogenase family protein [Patescibacteria group bacterium]
MAKATDPQIHRNFIDGEWVDSQRGQTLENRNPANNDLIGTFPSSDQRDVEAAVEAARRAFRSWRLVPAPKRAEILFRAAERLVARKEELAREMTREMGKILVETRGDVQEAIDMTYYMAGEGRRQFGQTTPSELQKKFAMSVREPVGPCALITPWNFPMAIPSWKIMPALILGNTVVLKPGEDTPFSSCRLVEVLSEAGLPPGVVNLVAGLGADAGEPLVRHAGVKLASFTGSTETGRKISQICAAALKPCHLEMGGKNIIVVMDDANLDLALEGAVWGGFGTTGQRCTAASRIAVQKTVYREFVDRLTRRARALRVGDGLDPETEMGPLINRQQLETVTRYVAIGSEDGARLATGGHRLEGGAWDKGWFFEATVFADCDPKMRICQEEIFGPVVSVIPVDDYDSAIEVANGVGYGLSAAIYTRNVNRAFDAMRELEAGIVYVNAPTIGAETHLPFGGIKWTGNGHREAAVAALDFYSEWKTLYIDYSDRLQRAQIDTGAFGAKGE